MYTAKPTRARLLFSLWLSASVFIISCHDPIKPLTPGPTGNIKDSVGKMVASIARDISDNGPVAWLKYFENTPDFFMASEGQLVFKNHDSAAGFIKNTLVKTIQKIELHWSDVRIDPLTTNFANIAAGFHEDITDFSHNTISVDGYFTGVAELTTQGWQLRNAHWSTGTKK